MRYSEIITEDAKSRIARAQEQGFDVDHVYYHGTAGNVSKFQRKFHGSTMGAHNREPFAVWLTSAAGVADVYANHEPSDAVWWGDPKDAPKPRVNPAPNIIPLYIRLKNTMVFDASNLTHFALLRQKGWLLDQAKKYGHDGLILKNAEDGTDERSDIVAVFNPSNVRSVFANFDPSKTRTTDLLS